MGWLTRWFGQEGKVRFEFETEDGQTFIAKVQIEAFNISNEQLEKKLAEMVYVETGHKAKRIKVLGFAQTN